MMFKTVFTLNGVLLMLVMLLFQSALSATEMPRVVARVGDVEVTTLDLQAYLERFAPQERAQLLAQPDQLNRAVGALIYWRAVAAEAKAKAADQAPLIAAQLRIENERALGELYLLQEDQRLIAPAQIEGLVLAEYHAHPERYKVPEQISARHILLLDGKRTAEQDQQLLQEIDAQLRAGADFGELATKYSDDPASASKGGDLGTFGRGRMVEAFEQVAFGLEPGEISKPVKTNFGWHLIKLETKQPERMKPYEEARDEIVMQVRARLMAENRERRAQALQNDPSLQVNQDVIRSFIEAAQ